MKKVFLIFFAFFLVTDSFSQGLDFGVKVGVNFSNFTGVDGLK